jgi:hypothetical protein
MSEWHIAEYFSALDLNGTHLAETTENSLSARARGTMTARRWFAARGAAELLDPRRFRTSTHAVDDGLGREQKTVLGFRVGK